jgi:lysylphosphatidylglycerol synthetase-like protein (DUF2156 family)
MTGEGSLTRNSHDITRVAWRGWIFLALMLAILVGMDLVLLPTHPGLAMAASGAWAAVTVVVGLRKRIGDVHWRDILKGDG